MLVAGQLLLSKMCYMYSCWFNMKEKEGLNVLRSALGVAEESFGPQQACSLYKPSCPIKGLHKAVLYK